MCLPSDRSIRRCGAFRTSGLRHALPIARRACAARFQTAIRACAVRFHAPIYASTTSLQIALQACAACLQTTSRASAVAFHAAIRAGAHAGKPRAGHAPLAFRSRAGHPALRFTQRFGQEPHELIKQGIVLRATGLPPNGLAFSCRERAGKTVKIRTISRAKRSAAMPGWAAIVSTAF